MDVEQAERFVQAAERDYQGAVVWYCAMMEGRADGPEDVVQPRADVLAAQQVLDLARNELRWQQTLARQQEAAEEERVRKEAEAVLHAQDARNRERWRRERQDREALDRAAEEGQP